jgi:amino acid adenylation domain-containing protein
VRRDVLDAFQHPDLPFEKLVEELNPERNPSRHPLFQVTFALENTPAHPLVLAGMEVSRYPLPTKSSHFDLELSVWEEGGKLAGSFVYNPDLFEPVTIERMSGYYRMLLEGMLADPLRPVSEMPMLIAAEQHQLLVEWNGKAANYPREACIHQIFERQVERTPESTALVFKEQQLSYRELNRRANRFADRLRKLGAGPVALVAVRAERSFEMVVSILGILKAGSAYVPLDTADPVARWHSLIETNGVRFLVADGRPEEGLPAGVKLVSDNPADEGESDSTPERIANPLDLACVFFTSGSTRTPKGVAVPHRAVLRLLFGVDYVQLGPEEVVLQMAPMSFDAATFELWGALLHGGRCVLFPERVPTVAMLGETLARHGVTTLWLTSSLFNLVIDEAPAILQHVRQLLSGGEALSVGHLRRALELLPRTRLINGYGPTEGTTFTCCYTIRESPEEAARSIPIGKPISNTKVYLLDNHLNVLPVGVPGELYIGGDGLARGYLNQPELTAERFVRDPFSRAPGARMYKTGDLGRWLPDGTIQFLGRNDFQVKMRGFRIELGEIEARILEFPAIGEAVVLAREDSPGDKRLVAYYVRSGGAKEEGEHEGEMIGAEGLRNHLLARLPHYMVPAAYVQLQKLPLNPNGKVDRKALPAPGLDAYAGGGYEAPQGEIEIMLAQIWAELLKLERVGRHDNFFDLGGHSLLAVQLVSRIGEAIDRRPSISDLFQGPTVVALARLLAEKHSVDGRDQAASQSVVPIRPEGSKPPLFLLHVYDGEILVYRQIVRHLDTDRPVFGIRAAKLAGDPTSVSSMEELAGIYVREILRVRPEGPYHLAGYSCGGLVAFEIARQLRLASKSVGLLAILDTDTGWLQIRWSRKEQTARLARQLRYRVDVLSHLVISRTFRDIVAGHLRHRVDILKKKRWKDWAASIRKRSAKLINGRNPEDEGRAHREIAWVAPEYQHISKALRSLAVDWAPEPFPGRAVLFQSRYQSKVRFESRESRNVWMKLVRDLQVYELDCSHESLVLEPRAGHVANMLTKLLGE